MMVGTIYIIILFLIFLLQWEIKRRWQIKKAGIDPDVLKKSLSPIQKYMNKMNLVLTFYIVILITCHGLEVQLYNFFSMFEPLNYLIFDHVGFATGLFGLGIALYAQIKMGSSWRVGIDEKNHSELITDGLYRFIRNPTYLGIFFLLIGIWVIWPTWSIAIFCMLFCFFFEVQVRCEEEYLFKIHGKLYQEYFEQTKRYIPFVY